MQAAQWHLDSEFEYFSARHLNALRHDSSTARLLAALRSGAPEQLFPFQYMAANGYRIGNDADNSYGYGERVVLEEALRDATLPLERVGLFFRELGGRFMVSPIHDVCVFSVLVQIDQAHHHPPNAALPPDSERWAARMAEVVRYLVEEAGMPMDAAHGYRAVPEMYMPRQTLLVMARKASAWAAYAAFRPYFFFAPRDDRKEGRHLMLQVLLCTPDATVAYWARRLGIATLSDGALQRMQSHVHARGGTPEAHATLAAEIQRRAAERVHMRALLMLQARDPSNAWARDTLEDPYLAQHIHTLAWNGTRY